MNSEDFCNLSPEELEKRQAFLRAEVMIQVKHSEARARGRSWDFERNPEMEAKLEQLVEFERGCCGGLEWSLLRPEGSNTLRLQVDGIDPDHALLRPVVPAGEKTAGGLAQIAKAGGIGLGLSFFVFCVLPIAAIALLGGSAAGALAKLDDPLVVGAGSLALALPTWFWLRHRRAKAGACDPGC